jgi:hypothetical protein
MGLISISFPPKAFVEQVLSSQYRSGAIRRQLFGCGIAMTHHVRLAETIRRLHHENRKAVTALVGLTLLWSAFACPFLTARAAAAIPSCPNHTSQPEDCPKIICQATLYLAPGVSESPLLAQFTTVVATLPEVALPAKAPIARSAAATASGSPVFLRTHSLLI